MSGATSPPHPKSIIVGMFNRPLIIVPHIAAYQYALKTLYKLTLISPLAICVCLATTLLRNFANTQNISLNACEHCMTQHYLCNCTVTYLCVMPVQFLGVRNTVSRGRKSFVHLRSRFPPRPIFAITALRVSYIRVCASSFQSTHSTKIVFMALKAHLLT